MKLTQEQLELQVLKHFITSKASLIKAKTLNISADHFCWIYKEVPEDKKPKLYTQMLYKLILEYYDKSDSLVTFPVLENKMINSRLSDEHKSDLLFIWTEIQKQDINENELHEFLMQLKRNRAMRETNNLFQSGGEIFTRDGVEKTIDFFEEKVSIIRDELSEFTLARQNFDFSTVGEEFKNEYLKRLRNKDRYMGIPSGLSILDKKTHGWQGGQVNVLLGSSSGGKSTHLLNFGHHAWMKAKKNILYFSYEMDRWTCLLRHISLCFEIPISLLRGLEITEEKLSTIVDQLNNLQTENYFEYVISSDNNTPESIDTKIRELAITKGLPDCVFIDQIAHMTTRHTKRDAPPWQRAGDAIEILHQIAKRYDIPFITAQQVNRETIKENRKLKAEGKSRQYWQDSASGDQRVIHYAHYVIAMEGDKENNICIYTPVKMREAFFDEFVSKVDPEINAIFDLEVDEQEHYRNLLGLHQEEGLPEVKVRTKNTSIKKEDKSNSLSLVVEDDKEFENLSELEDIDLSLNDISDF